uniref:Uncharacterized protein n=1 Tax=Anopheles atroparvus TaxID=41427 RepID=A0A182JA95_ANOAO
MERAQEKHKDRSWSTTTTFVDNIYVMWNQLLGLLTVFNGFHGKLYYDYSSCCITNRSTALDQNGHDLSSRGYPKLTFLDINRPIETISNLIDHVSKRLRTVKISSVHYVKTVINYVKDLLKLGKVKQFLQQYNVTEMTDKLTDTLNLEAIATPHCDKYILCEINSHDPNNMLRRRL